MALAHKCQAARDFCGRPERILERRATDLAGNCSACCRSDSRILGASKAVCASRNFLVKLRTPALTECSANFCVRDGEGVCVSFDRFAPESAACFRETVVCFVKSVICSRNDCITTVRSQALPVGADAGAFSGVAEVLTCGVSSLSATFGIFALYDPAANFSFKSAFLGV